MALPGVSNSPNPASIPVGNGLSVTDPSYAAALKLQQTTSDNQVAYSAAATAIQTKQTTFTTALQYMQTLLRQVSQLGDGK
ncbi:hypothetical protein [Paraburkholderia humisilvae]|uniref:Uncharacterized protein n=1 Tax=Paraburkholderia humisilvae TaxID=627669 RepID=A0A6J5F6R9_9BURK|nr:hypothetical protein [Paraburkholderia humisilvae]CAB3772856.1 hypothetical protein LMG29542_06997 [Paraburkholderia humisilvae]